MKSAFTTTSLLLLFLASISASIKLDEVLRHGVALMVQNEGSESSIKRENPTFAQVTEAISSIATDSGAIKSVVTMLNHLMVEVNDEQDQHDRINTEIVQECNEEIEYRIKEMAEASVTLGQAHESLGTCQHRFSTITHAIFLNEDFIQKKNQELSALKVIREIQRKQFDNRYSHVQDAIRSIEIVMQNIESMLSSSVSFAQMQNHGGDNYVLSETTSQAVGILAKLFSNHKTQTLTKTINVLTQIASHLQDLQPSDLSRLLDLLKILKGNMEEESDSIVANENRSLAAHQNQVNSLTQVIDVLQTQIHHFEQLELDFKACVGDETLIISAATAKKNRNALLHDKAVKMCSASKKEYDLSKRTREECLTLYRKIIEWLNDYQIGEKEKISNGPSESAQATSKLPEDIKKEETQGSNTTISTPKPEEIPITTSSEKNETIQNATYYLESPIISEADKFEQELDLLWRSS